MAYESTTTDTPPDAGADKPKRTRGPNKPKVAEVPAGPLKEWDVKVPGDPTLPPRRVKAETAGDAERVYKAEMGIITCGHPIAVLEAEDSDEGE